ncbi:hypothetical protein CRG98_022667 [Punica granatum]|uniref:Uncharacterized protein n=1 Tax=Punica granatum TaxID=22663 RepID=A0A2I0JKY4_PUNGR|nr:hypothetical protein CRG98_022667 [Punica granatum]
MREAADDLDYGGGPNLISWRSKKQPAMSKSSTEANPIIACYDNISDTYLVVNHVQHDRGKHIAVAYHFVRERIARGDLLVRYVPTFSQLADILTKCSCRSPYFRRKEDCRTVQEQVYWAHFRTIHFLQFFHCDLEKQLAVPKKFAENMKNKLGGNVLLHGPGGSIWEREASYFCKRSSGQKERDGEVGFKRKAREGSEVVLESPLPQDVVAVRAPVKKPQELKETVPRTTVNKRRIVSRKRSSPRMNRKASEGSEVIIESPLLQGAAARTSTEEPHNPEETVPTSIVRRRRILTRNRTLPGNIGSERSPIVMNQEKKRSSVKSPPASSTSRKKGKGGRPLEASGCSGDRNPQFPVTIHPSHLRCGYMVTPNFLFV